MCRQALADRCLLLGEQSRERVDVGSEMSRERIGGRVGEGSWETRCAAENSWVSLKARDMLRTEATQSHPYSRALRASENRETPHSGVHKRPEAAAQSEAGEAPVRTGSGTIA